MEAVNSFFFGNPLCQPTPRQASGPPKWALKLFVNVWLYELIRPMDCLLHSQHIRPGDNSVSWVSTTVSQVFKWGRSGSVWPLTFGLACCAIEMMQGLRLDRWEGILFISPPCQRMPRGTIWIAMGQCPAAAPGRVTSSLLLER